MGTQHVDWVPPESFDEYRLVQALGRGSMGQVWLAHDTVLDRLVAAKFIAELPGHDTARQRFLTEARAAARVQHPNIIAVYRVGEVGSRPYLISEYIRGESLDKIAQPVAWPRLCELAIGLARGLAAAHRQGVLHRDLKPANAIVSETGEVKLLDFGLAKLLPHALPGLVAAAPDPMTPEPLPGDPGAVTPASRSSREASAAPLDSLVRTVELPVAPGRGFSGGFALPSVTRADTVMGTPAYMSPEAWRGEPATPRSDVYSLGALLYTLAAGTPPHRGDSPEAMQEIVLSGDAPSLSVAAPGIDPRFAAVVDRCLRRDPAERFASGEAVLAALEALDPADLPAPGARGRDLEQPSSLPRRGRFLFGAAVALALLLALWSYHARGGAHARPPAAASSAQIAQIAQADRPAQRSPRTPPLAAGAYPGGAAAGRCPEGMVLVPAGSFSMGSPDGEGRTDEQPRHEVTLSAYCIDRTEVTVAAYAACAAAGGCSDAPGTVNWTSYTVEDVKVQNRRCNRMDRPDHPINCVDWDQAAAYCAWQGKRLPTEAEWEYAARGRDGRIYPWGSEAPSAMRLNARGHEFMTATTIERSSLDGRLMYDDDDGWDTTAPVGSFPAGASSSGALDMAGNVWEWTSNWYGVYANAAELDPQGPTRGTSRVSRGGGWATIEPHKASVTFRRWDTPQVRDSDLGFRCALGH